MLVRLSQPSGVPGVLAEFGMTNVYEVSIGQVEAEIVSIVHDHALHEIRVLHHLPDGPPECVLSILTGGEL